MPSLPRGTRRRPPQPGPPALLPQAGVPPDLQGIQPAAVFTVAGASPRQSVCGASRLMPLRFQKIEPQMDTDGHRFSRNHTWRSALSADGARNLRKSFLLSVYPRPSAVKIPNLKSRLTIFYHIREILVALGGSPNAVHLSTKIRETNRGWTRMDGRVESNGGLSPGPLLPLVEPDLRI